MEADGFVPDKTLETLHTKGDAFMEKYTKSPTTFKFRKCTASDLNAVMALQETVYQGIKNKDVFVPSNREQNQGFLKAPGFIFGCFDGAKLIAYSSLVIRGNNPDNLGWDLGWPQEKVLSCALLDTIVVHPVYRGNHLQQRLIEYTLKILRENPSMKYLLTTVSPQNQYSLHNVQAMGFEIVLKKMKYGGKERFILCLTL